MSWSQAGVWCDQQPGYQLVDVTSDNQVNVALAVYNCGSLSGWINSYNGVSNCTGMDISSDTGGVADVVFNFAGCNSGQYYQAPVCQVANNVTLTIFTTTTTLTTALNVTTLSFTDQATVTDISTSTQSWTTLYLTWTTTTTVPTITSTSTLTNTTVPETSVLTASATLTTSTLTLTQTTSVTSTGLQSSTVTDVTTQTTDSLTTQVTTTVSHTTTWSLTVQLSVESLTTTTSTTMIETTTTTDVVTTETVVTASYTLTTITALTQTLTLETIGWSTQWTFLPGMTMTTTQTYTTTSITTMTTSLSPVTYVFTYTYTEILTTTDTITTTVHAKHKPIPGRTIDKLSRNKGMKPYEPRNQPVKPKYNDIHKDVTANHWPRRPNHPYRKGNGIIPPAYCSYTRMGLVLLNNTYLQADAVSACQSMGPGYNLLDFDDDGILQQAIHDVIQNCQSLPLRLWIRSYDAISMSPPSYLYVDLSDNSGQLDVQWVYLNAGVSVGDYEAVLCRSIPPVSTGTQTQTYAASTVTTITTDDYTTMTMTEFAETDTLSWTTTTATTTITATISSYELDIDVVY
jgi:hypothetical protein